MYNKYVAWYVGIWYIVWYVGNMVYSMVCRYMVCGIM